MCVFNKQKHLKLYNNSKINFIKEDNNENKFLSIDLILENCPNITSILIMTDERYINELFERIIKYCNNLYEMQFSIKGLSIDTMKRFCLKFGPKLKRIKFFFEDNTLCQQFLKFCPNLRQLSINRLNCIFDGNEILCQKLKSIEFYYSSEDKTRFDSLVESNKKSLESLRIVVNYDVIESDLKVLFKSIAKLTELKSFKFTLNYITININYILFIDFLEDLAKNCKLLEILELNVIYLMTEKISQYFFNAFTKIKTLKSLSLINSGINMNSREIISSKEFNELKHLKHLKLRNCCRLTNKFFDSIDEYIPQLQTIECDCEPNITEKAFQSLAKARSLQKIKFDINCRTLNFNELHIKHFIENSTKIDLIILNLKTEKIDLNEEKIFKIRNRFAINCFDIPNRSDTQ